MSELNKQLDEILDDNFRTLSENSGEESPKSKKSKTLLQHLFGAKCPVTGRGFARHELRDQITTLLVAGHKTTTLLLVWAIWNIATHGDVEEKLTAEITRFL